MVQCLVEHGAIDCNNHGDFSTPLGIASGQGYGEIVEYLIGKGFDVNLVNMFGLSSIQFAAASGHFNIVKILVENGANITITDDYGNDALSEAAKTRNIKIVEYLLDHSDEKGNNKRSTIVHLAAMRENLDILKLCFDKGIDVDICNINGETPLHSAVLCDSLESIRFLIDLGADVHAKSNFGITPIFNVRSIEATKLLFEHGADIHLRDRNNDTLLHYVIDSFFDISKFLIEKGIDLNARNIHGESALSIASQSCEIEIVFYLIEHGSDMMVRWEDGHVDSLNCIHILAANYVDPYYREYDSNILSDFGLSNALIENGII